MKQVGPCRLCEKHQELQESHLLPRAAHKETKDNGRNILAINRRGWANARNQKDFTERLLCFNCEQRLSVFERIAIETCRSAFDCSSSKMYQLPKNSVDALLKFAYSVFWRASVSSLFEDYSLGENIEKELKDAFYDGSMPQPPHLPISMSFLQVSGIKALRRILMSPWIESHVAGLKISYFTMFGIVFRLHFPDALHESEEREFLRAHEKSGTVYPLRQWEVDGINNMIADSIAISKRVDSRLL